MCFFVGGQTPDKGGGKFFFFFLSSCAHLNAGGQASKQGF